MTPEEARVLEAARAYARADKAWIVEGVDVYIDAAQELLDAARALREDA